MKDTTLTFHVEDRRFSIRSVSVFVNWRPVSGNQHRSIQLEIPRDRRSLDLNVPVRLDDGDNLITITALGKSEAVDSLHVIVLTDRLAGHMEMDTVWILAIGVNRYQDKKLRNLSYAANDAQGIIQAFEAQEGKTCNKVMSLEISDSAPAKPTTETIVNNLTFLHQAKEEDLAVLFLAGHGVNDARGDFYFLPSDAEVLGPGDFRTAKAITGAELQSAVEIPARRFVFVDACHSEEMAVDVVRLSREFKENRVLAMSSNEGSSPSVESNSLKHGLFT